MDCIEAQGILSETLDRSPVAADRLAEAQAHCLECPACRANVKALRAIQAVPLPEPPVDIVSRVMTAVRAEAAERDAAAAVAGAASEAAAQSEDDTRRDSAHWSTDMASLETATAQRAARRRRSGVAWSAAAAVLVVAVGAAAIGGLRQMATPVGESKTLSSREFAPSRDGVAGLPEGEAGAPQASATTPVPGSPQLIAVSGKAYGLAGADTGSTSQLRQIGTVTTSLSGSAATPRAVFEGPDPKRIYLRDDSGTLVAFDLVTRAFTGSTYQLTSADLKSFGEWPALPVEMASPTAADGSPTFLIAGTDSSGVKVYRLKDRSTADGIAIPPNTPSTDPAGGNPGWTWWEPLR